MSSKEEEKKEIGLNNSGPEKLTQSSAALTESKTAKDSNDAEDDDPDTSCGFGPWRPRWFQKAAETKLFLFFYSIAGISQGAGFTYFVGCISTMGKRYAYDTKQSGFIMIAEEIGPILLGVLVGYFGGLTHRPRFLSFGMLLGALSSFVFAIPYFIYGSRRFDENLQQPETKLSGINAQICDKEFNTIGLSCEHSAKLPVVVFFFLANFLKGISGVIYYSIETSYVDDNTKKKNSPVYFGAVFALRLLDTTVGFLLSSLCLQFYEDPFYDPGFGTRDPRWVGAWWLGFIILGVLISIFSVPMILFPKRFPKKKIPASLQEKKPEEEPKSPIEQLNGGVLRLNGVLGYYVLLPKYMEMQFRQSASKASLYSGPASIIGMMLGILLGGISIRKFRPRPRRPNGRYCHRRVLRHR